MTSGMLWGLSLPTHCQPWDPFLEKFCAILLVLFGFIYLVGDLGFY